MVLLLQPQVQRVRINVTTDIVYGIEDSEAFSCLPKTMVLQERSEMIPNLLFLNLREFSQLTTVWVYLHREFGRVPLSNRKHCQNK